MSCCRGKEEGKHNLKIATVFSYNSNKDDLDAFGMINYKLKIMNDGLSMAVKPSVNYGEQFITENKHTREKWDKFITHYNQMFETKFSTQDS